ncbi:hypothetical protein ACA758_01255 [Mycoplasmopsis agassizii]|uniref:Uncharacterized protein n=1 Tax=Mycoplasmopsis agassizii TaxID=33922 RepID=A0A1W1WXC9_9BACT|nr:hypothetical protein [Mycoplasmopsis agassizii]PAF54632.1 hypothetical protein CJF60_02740 [Mycoplasmopsis agassizii]PAK21064.1 hypothetical protein CJJ23_04010 [Mycoplasmopsis agassizii]SMC16294.1 hypothetical protein SAMN02745179_00254 [Mycoplasmopsis agassizii]
MAIKRISRSADLLDLNNTAVIVGIKTNSIGNTGAFDNELYELEKRRKENRQFYHNILTNETKSDTELLLDQSVEAKFIRQQSNVYLDLYNDLKRYSTEKLMDFVEFYKMNIEDVKAFHFLILNKTTFASWFQNIAEQILIFKTKEVFYNMADALSTERGFDIGEKWVIDATKALINFITREYLPSIKSNYFRDWQLAKIKYSRFLESGGIKNLHFDE